MNKMKVPVVEIFPSVQGEGLSIGEPCIFLRFYGCTLRCTFDGVECDTPYAVHTEKDKAKLMTVNDIENKIGIILKKYPNIKRLVCTGGEPTLYQDMINELCLIIDNSDVKVEVETNGTVPVNSATTHNVDQFNVSIKLKSSNQLGKTCEDKRINWKAIESFPAEKTTFKFVVSTEEDIKEVNTLLNEYKETMNSYNMPNVMLMPMGDTREKIIKNSPQVIEWCMKHNYRFSPREHIMIWDKGRGV